MAPYARPILSTKAAGGDHPRRICFDLGAVVVAPEFVDGKAVALQEKLELAGKDRGHVEDDLLAMLAAGGIEPFVVEGYLNPLAAHVTADVGGLMHRAIELGHIKRGR